MEEWKDIPGFEGLYQASTFGNVRSCEGKVTYSVRHGERHWKQRIIKQQISMNGKGREDARVKLYKDKKQITRLVSRLIALTWCAGYQEGWTVNHKNGDHLDNRADNLEWISLGDNIRHGFANGLYPQAKFDGDYSYVDLKTG